MYATHTQKMSGTWAPSILKPVKCMPHPKIYQQDLRDVEDYFVPIHYRNGPRNMLVYVWGGKDPPFSNIESKWMASTQVLDTSMYSYKERLLQNKNTEAGDGIFGIFSCHIFRSGSLLTNPLQFGWHHLYQNTIHIFLSLSKYFRPYLVFSTKHFSPHLKGRKTH